MITIDSNIYISALHYGGRPMELLERAMDGAVEVAVSDAILTEVERTLGEKFRWSTKDLAAGRAMILSFAQFVQPVGRVTAIAEDPSDDRILECAVASGSEAIVTGDKDLLRRVQYRGIRIVTVAEFLER